MEIGVCDTKMVLLNKLQCTCYYLPFLNYSLENTLRIHCGMSCLILTFNSRKMNGWISYLQFNLNRDLVETDYNKIMFCEYKALKSRSETLKKS